MAPQRSTHGSKSPHSRSQQSSSRQSGKARGGHSFANVTHSLRGMDFPAKKQDLINKAKENKADKDVFDELEKMKDREYGSMADVMKEFGRSH